MSGGKAGVAARPAPRLAAGDWAYNNLHRHNARVVSVVWDESLYGYNGGWRYNVPGLSDPDLQQAREDRPYVEYAQVQGSANCWKAVAP